MEPLYQESRLPMLSMLFRRPQKLRNMLILVAAARCWARAVISLVLEFMRMRESLWLSLLLQVPIVLPNITHCSSHSNINKMHDF